MNDQLLEALTALKAVKDADAAKTNPPALVVALPVPTYTHESLVNYIIENPGTTPELISAHFGQPKRWFLTILATDSFQLALDGKRHLIADPTITATMEERFRALSLHSLDVLSRKLDSKEVSDLLVLKASEIGVKALGMGNVAPAVPALAPAGNVDTLAERLVAALEKQRRNVRAPVTFENSAQSVVEVDSGS